MPIKPRKPKHTIRVVVKDVKSGKSNTFTQYMHPFDRVARVVYRAVDGLKAPRKSLRKSKDAA